MRNIVFLAIAASLITYIYFFEEVKDRKELKESKQKEALFDSRNLGSLKSIHFKSFKLVKEEGGIKVLPENIQGDNAMMNKFFDELMNVKVQRVLAQDNVKEDLFIEKNDPSSMSFEFENNKLEFVLGKKLEFNTHFYLKVIDHKKAHAKWVVAKYETSYTGVYNKKDSHRSDGPYVQFKGLIDIDSRFFYNYNPFIGLQNIKELSIESFRNRKALISFSELRTDPPSIKGLGYDLENFKDYISKLNKIKASSLEKKSSPLKERIGTVEVEGVKLEVFRKYGEDNGYFLLRDGYVYTISSHDFRNIFVSHTYFWNRKIRTKASTFFLGKRRLEKEGEGSFIFQNAHNVFKQAQRDFKFKEKINSKADKTTFFVNYDITGVYVLDPRINTVFHFLEKIE